MQTLRIAPLLVFLGCGSPQTSVQSTPEPVVDAPAPSAPVLDEPAPSQAANDGAEGGVACGSRGLAACAEGQYCSYPLTAHCGETDRPGRCTVKSQACTKIYEPVCGCDGKLYGNACTASSAGQSVASTGPCPKH